MTDRKLIDEFHLWIQPGTPREGSKRQYLPIVLRWTCPTCHKEVKDDMGTDPALNNPTLCSREDTGEDTWNKFWFYCPHCEDEFTDFQIKVEVDIKLRRKP